MNNIESEPSLLLPEIPTNFEALAGTSRTDFAKAIFELLAGAKISGINVEPSPYDLAALTAQVNQMQLDVNLLKARKVLKFSITVTSNNERVISFGQDLGTTNYTVTAVYTSPKGANIPTVTWSVVDKQSTYVTIRQDGTANATMGMDVVIWLLPDQ
jgi:hypothetical protein